MVGKRRDGRGGGGGAPQAVLPTAQSFLGWLPRGRMTSTPSHVYLM